jgi:hypothetical protein
LQEGGFWDGLPGDAGGGGWDIEQTESLTNGSGGGYCEGKG